MFEIYQYTVTASIPLLDHHTNLLLMAVDRNRWRGIRPH